MILLADANILFDFGWVDGLTELVSLGPFEVLENVLDEVARDEQLRNIAQTLEGLGVTFVPLADGWTDGIRAAKRGGLSLPDASCLHYAKLHERTVLTSERALRKRCQAEGVAVHGSLWVVAQLHQQGLCTPDRLCEWLRRWPEQGARLPARQLQELRTQLGCMP
ncbi:hypothetical protein QOL99_11065 [Deinococcus sp. MIMF12]|uniref:PIN domain-containing protein n=1 Tax=Deinococcus rhizophilus TaxID=3049544 RepID=A0ABT7JJB6_9DEIO|nr:hypothetical protein [Deinococcus rhizophilus]MDL2344687.1 hypothetical protein [Deinococcus rhizophilus]